MELTSLPDSKIKWVAGLSNGVTLVEGEGIVSNIPGEDSAWHKLQKYIKDNNLTVNSFYLSLGDKHFNLPSVKPKFGGMVPITYNCFRYVDTDFATTTLYGLFKCAEAVYSDFKVQLYINEMDTNKSWVNIVHTA